MRKNINKNEKVREYLIEYPFSAAKVYIPIFCDNNDDSSSTFRLSVVSCSKGWITYKAGDNQEEVYQESYEEGLKIV